MSEKTKKHCEKIIAMLSEQESATAAEIGDYVGLKSTRVKQLLQMLMSDGTVAAEGSNKNRKYSLSK